MLWHWYWQQVEGNVLAVPLCAIVAAAGGLVLVLMRDRIGRRLAGWWHKHYSAHERAAAQLVDQPEPDECPVCHDTYGDAAGVTEHLDSGRKGCGPASARLSARSSSSSCHSSTHSRSFHSDSRAAKLSAASRVVNSATGSPAHSYGSGSLRTM